MSAPRLHQPPDGRSAQMGASLAFHLVFALFGVGLPLLMAW
jgi:cytochrome bd-type quinol oxidase subunit 1